MPSSHPPSLRTHVRRFLKAHPDCHGQRIIVACSGGPDSTALLHALASWRAAFSLQLHAVGIDHGLRVEALQELAMAEALATRLEIPWRSMHGTLGQDGSHARSNLQARARTLRYTLLLEAAQACNATAIAVGHTQDDLAETVLMRLLRGSGPRGLIAMSPVDAFPLPSAMMLATETPPPLPLILRPLLHARRSDVMIHLTRHALPSATDPSNTNTDFLRVRVRHTLLPQLAEMSPAIVEHLAALSSALDELPTVSPPAAATVDPALTPLLGRSHWTRLREATPGPIPGPMSGERPKGTLLLRAGPGSPPHVISYFRKRNGSPDDNQDP